MNDLPVPALSSVIGKDAKHDQRLRRILWLWQRVSPGYIITERYNWHLLLG